MTREQLIAALKKCTHEEEHTTADELLVDFINDPEVAEAYYKVPKWYE